MSKKSKSINLLFSLRIAASAKQGRGDGRPSISNCRPIYSKALIFFLIILSLQRIWKNIN